MSSGTDATRHLAADAFLYPPIEPNASGRLAVDARHSLYWEECGNPLGVPVLFLHGGPGAGLSKAHRQFFDPAFYRIVLFDQRGAGQSTPLGEVRDNTTPHLVADIERLRELDARHPEIGDVRGRGLFIGMELVKDRASKVPAKELCDATITRAFHNGLLLLSCGTSTVRFMPPLLITRRDVDEVMTIVDASLTEAREALRGPR